MTLIDVTWYSVLAIFTWDTIVISYDCWHVHSTILVEPQCTAYITTSGDIRIEVSWSSSDLSLLYLVSNLIANFFCPLPVSHVNGAKYLVDWKKQRKKTSYHRTRCHTSEWGASLDGQNLFHFLLIPNMGLFILSISVWMVDLVLCEEYWFFFS